MSELTFTLVDVIMFVFGGMALGFVIGAAIMKKTAEITMAAQQDLKTIEDAFKAVLSVPLPDDGGASFHEDCGDR